MKDIIIGNEYSKKELWPGPGGPPKTGKWIEGNNFLTFFNIGIPNAFGVVYPNEYDVENKRITWYGSEGSCSAKTACERLINGELTHYFFARWQENDKFTFLGVEKRLLEYEDNVELPQGDNVESPQRDTAIKMIYSLPTVRKELLIGREYRKQDLWIGRGEIPSSGKWITSNNYLVFCDIGTLGSPEVDYPNEYDEENKKITWYGSKGTHSEQLEFKRLINGALTHYFFARWKKDGKFTFLGVGKRLLEYEANVGLSQDSTTIKMIYSLGHYTVGNNEKKVYIDL